MIKVQVQCIWLSGWYAEISTAKAFWFANGDGEKIARKWWNFVTRIPNRLKIVLLLFCSDSSKQSKMNIRTVKAGRCRPHTLHEISKNFAWISIEKKMHFHQTMKWITLHTPYSMQIQWVNIQHAMLASWYWKTYRK